MKDSDSANNSDQVKQEPSQTDGDAKKPEKRKNLIKQLYNGFEDDLFQHQITRSSRRAQNCVSDFTIALSTHIATGLRPAELQKGVIFRLIGSLVEIEIAGSKFRQDKSGKHISGIETRWLSINPEFSQASAFLCDWVKRRIEENSSGANQLFFSYKKNSFRDQIAGLSEQFNRIYRPQRKPVSITGNTFRHNFSAWVKTCKLSKVEIAKAMGHCSTKSQSEYGNAFRRKSKHSPISPISSVEVSHEPRVAESKYSQSKTQPTKTSRKPSKKSTPSNAPSL